MSLIEFIKRHIITIFITIFIIILYLIFHFFLSLFIERNILIIIFISLLLFILFPIKEYLVNQQFISPNWDYLIHSEFHHFEFLAKFFSLRDMIYQITPELMAWLKIPESRLIILNPDKKTFTMYLIEKGKVKNTQIIQKKRIQNLLKLIKRYQKIIYKNDNTLSSDIKNILQKLSIHIIVPFYHLNRLMGFIAFLNPTTNKHASRAFELYAIKAALLIHDEILKRRIQNITKYEEEIKISEKIRQMLQTYTPPEIPNFKITIHKINSATIIEYFYCKSKCYIIFLSIPRVNGISALILSGKLGYLYAYLQDHKEDFNVKNLLEFLYFEKEYYLENYPIQILILELETKENYIKSYIDNYQQYFITINEEKPYKIFNNMTFYLQNNDICKVYYKEQFLLQIKFYKKI